MLGQSTAGAQFGTSSCSGNLLQELDAALLYDTMVSVGLQQFLLDADESSRAAAVSARG